MSIKTGNLYTFNLRAYQLWYNNLSRSCVDFTDDDTTFVKVKDVNDDGTVHVGFYDHHKQYQFIGMGAFPIRFIIDEATS